MESPYGMHQRPLGGGIASVENLRSEGFPPMLSTDPTFLSDASNGDPINKEEYKLDETVKLIRNAGIALKCTIMTRTKALLIYHHFKTCVLETEYEPHTVAAACISLSIKYNEEKVSLESIVLLFLNMIDPGEKKSTQNTHFQSSLRAVSNVECLILRMLEFDLNHTIAHQYLAYFMNDLQEELSVSNVWDVFAETCMRIASDFYLSNKCKIYKADEIAISAIKVALYMVGIDSTYFKLRLKNLNDVAESTNQRIIDDIFGICYMGSLAESRNMELQ